MYCVRNVTEDLYWVGANERRQALFEGVYKIPRGVSYNSYLLLDEKTVLFDTVDKNAARQFLENVAHVLNGRKLDYVIVQHMEPDHCDTLQDIVLRYPEVTVVCSEMAADMIEQFFEFDLRSRLRTIAEGDTLESGKHTFTFLSAPMVHWPEVMVTYDVGEKILFSADAFGTFGALDGALFADEVDFFHDFIDEARRYYTNIVGKYGPQVQMLLKKAAGVEIKMVCPLHGFVWRKKFSQYLDKYIQWATYTPEETGVMIAYASVYGHTAAAADILAAKLRDMGIKTVVYDTSVSDVSEVVAASFRYSHLVFASTTYNAGIYISMEDLLHDIVNHALQDRTVAFIENGTWQPVSGSLMRELLEPLPGMKFVDKTLTLNSSLKNRQLDELNALANAIAETIPGYGSKPAPAEEPVDPNALFKFSYGLFVLSAKDGDKDNGCIINTGAQLTDTPKRINIAVNKVNYTHDMIKKTGVFNLSILTEDATMEVFKRFGFQSGRDADKFEGCEGLARSANGLYYLTEGTNAVLSGKVIEAHDYGTHTLFTADVTEARILSNEPSITYAYYFANVKPKPLPPAMMEGPKKGWLCKICGFIYEGDELPADYICPICKHGVSDFEYFNYED